MVQLQHSFVVTCKVSFMFIPTDMETIVLHAALAIINIAISLSGTLANGLVILAFYRNSRLRTIQNTIFLLLAIADLSVTALVEPTYSAAMLGRLFANPSCLLWDVYTVLTILFVQFSLATVVLLSLHSYVTLAYPYHHQSIITKSRLTIAIAISFILVSFSTFGVFLHRDISKYGSGVIVLVTITTVVFTWCWTYKLVARHRKAIETTQAPAFSHGIARRNSLRSTITAFVTIVSLLACYSPCLFLFFSEKLWDPGIPTSNTLKNVWPIATTFIYLNSLFNPCLVLWRNTSFRETVEYICLC